MIFNYVSRQEIIDRLCARFGESMRNQIVTAVENQPGKKILEIISGFQKSGQPGINIAHWERTIRDHCRENKYGAQTFCLQVLAALEDELCHNEQVGVSYFQDMDKG